MINGRYYYNTIEFITLTRDATERNTRSYIIECGRDTGIIITHH